MRSAGHQAHDIIYSTDSPRNPPLDLSYYRSSIKFVLSGPSGNLSTQILSHARECIMFITCVCICIRVRVRIYTLNYFNFPPHFIPIYSRVCVHTLKFFFFFQFNLYKSSQGNSKNYFPHK